MTESELKIPVADLAAVRTRLVAANGRCCAAIQREVNVLFDTSDRRLMSSGKALRLRRFAGAWLLTYKGPTSYRGPVKEREEIQVEVGDGPSVTAILLELGFSPALRYEKDRELWQVGEVTVTLDHTPLGDFVEVEGPAASLEGASARLGLDPTTGVRGSYVSLWRRHREEHPEMNLPVDMVFQP